MTLIVVGIGVPTIQNTSSSKDFLDALSKKDAEIISFFVSFLVLGFFWTAHHRFFSRLAAVDPALRAWNLVYLMFVAFLPFPTVLIGQNLDNAAAVSFYATERRCDQPARDGDDPPREQRRPVQGADAAGRRQLGDARLGDCRSSGSCCRSRSRS